MKDPHPQRYAPSPIRAVHRVPSSARHSSSSGRSSRLGARRDQTSARSAAGTRRRLIAGDDHACCGLREVAGETEVLTKHPHARHVVGRLTPSVAWWCAGFLVLVSAHVAGAQEVVGRRTFSDHVVVPEPFVEDELTLPSLLHIRRPRTGGERGALTTQIGAELKKRLTPDLEVSVNGGLSHTSSAGDSSVTGFDNLEIGLKYQFIRDPIHEVVASVAVGWEIGGTGRAAAGAEPFDTVSPTLLFGKGFGDLPDVFASFKPVAVAGLLGMVIPIRTTSPDLLHWGFLVEYSLPYLQSPVSDHRLPPPFNGFVPLIAMDMRTSLLRAARARAVGTANCGA